LITVAENYYKILQSFINYELRVTAVSDISIIKLVQVFYL